jgi:hypothetical protein
MLAELISRPDMAQRHLDVPPLQDGAKCDCLKGIGDIVGAMRRREALSR